MDTFTRKRSRPEDWEDIEPSKVVHIRDLCEHTLEIDIARALERFGTIRDIAMIPKRRQALVEFEDISSAEDVVRTYRNEMLFIASKPAKINFSTSEHVVKRTGAQNEAVSTANKVLIFFIYEAVYPITVEVITKICKPHGRVLRIFINRKAQVLQALVEFYSIEDAVRVKRNLNGADIYSGCCTLKIEFATTNRVNVSTNTEDSWDFENNICPPPMKQSLLGLPNGPRGMPQHRMDCHNDMSQMDRRPFPPPPSSSSHYNDSYRNEMMPYDDNRGPKNRMMPPMNDRSISYDNGFDRNDGVAELRPCVAMVYGLNLAQINCDKLFNLLCIYGNVMKIKFLKSKEGSAMVQLSDEISMARMMSLLHNHGLFGQTLQFQVSKQPQIMDVPVPYTLPDDTPSFKDFSSCRENRFMSPSMADKNRVFPPSMTVNYWNAPPHFGFEQIKEEFAKVGAVMPAEYFQLTDRDKSSSGLLQWATVEEATDCIALCNHIMIESEGAKYPYQLKLSFSESPIRHGPPKPGNPDFIPNFSRRNSGGRGGGRGPRGGGRGNAFKKDNRF